MKAETYLERVKIIDGILPDKREDYARWVELAEGLGGFSVSDRVQSSKNLQQMQKAIDKYLDIEREIDALEQERIEIIKTLESLPRYEYKTLHTIYVKDGTLKEIAYMFGMSYSWAKEKKKNGLSLIQAILDER